MKMNGKNLTRKGFAWIVAISLIVFIKIFTTNQLWVEKFYSTGFYIFFSKIQRILFGWIPFSIGDILYFIAACWLAWKVGKNLRLIVKRELTKRLAVQKALNMILLLAFVYCIFYLFWGINYDRKGIAYQLKLPIAYYDTGDLLKIQNLLLQKVNSAKLSVIKSGEKYPSTKVLIRKAKRSYEEAHKKFPFLNYTQVSAKPSMYGTLGNYLGFTGYYDPFTGEAQINTTVPQMLLPYIATHEIGHQLGYAKENEANFVGYLAAVSSPDTLFHYSAYLDLFLYTNREVYFFDSTAAKNIVQQLIPPVKQDLLELKKFDLAHQSVVEPFINWLYGNYLKWNNQPNGMHSYNAVVGMLIEYYKRYGKI